MESLADQITDALEKQGVYVVQDEELRRIWPDTRNRYRQVKDFATSHGWRLFAYGDGRGAMFARKGRANTWLRAKLDVEWWCDAN